MWILLLLLLSMPASAHGLADWIQNDPRYRDMDNASVHCCGPMDCAPLPSSRVRIISNGYLIDGDKWVAFDRAYQTRPDQLDVAEFWWCLRSDQKSIRCFFAPGGAS